MCITDICNLSQLEELFQQHEYIILKCSAEWCAPCKRIHPVYEKYSDNEKYTSVCFLHVDIDNARDISEKYKIESIPTFILFKNGIEQDRFLGPNEMKLCDLLNRCV